MQDIYFWPSINVAYGKNVLVTFHIVSMLIAIPGNLLILSTVLTSSKLENMASFMFISSVSIADLLVGSVAQPFIIYILMNTKENLFIDHLSYSIVWTLSSISGFGVIWLTFDRLIYFEYSLMYFSMLTRKRVLYIIMSQWFAGILFGVAPIFYKNDLFWKTLCLLTLVFINIFMVYVYYRLTKTIKRLKNAVVPINRFQCAMTKARTNKSNKSMIYIVFAFCLCWYPHLTTGFINVVIGPSNLGGIMMQWTLLLGCSNSSLNIFIYGTKNKVLRVKVMKRLARLSNYLRKDHDGSKIKDHDGLKSSKIGYETSISIFRKISAVSR